MTITHTPVSMLGDIADALDLYRSWVGTDTALQDWQYLGQGSYREVWGNGTEVAYKLNRTTSGGRYGMGRNDNEWGNYQHLLDKPLPIGVRIPRMWLYPLDAYGIADDVMAIERIDTSGMLNDCGRQCLCNNAYYGACQSILWDELSALGIYDAHNENVVPHAGVWYLIDLG